MSAVLRPVAAVGKGLKCFRLRDVPEQIRIEAARTYSESIARALKADRTGRHGGGIEGSIALNDAIEATRFAMHPPDGVYWISRDAWDAMIERAEKKGWA